jgi:hypothetical protein
VQNDKTDTASEAGKQDAYPGRVGSRLLVGAARIGLVSWAELSLAAKDTLPQNPAMFGVAGGKFVLFHAFAELHAAKAALRRRYKQLAALRLAYPKEVIGPAWLTPLGWASVAGQEFASELRRHRVEVSDIPLEESQPEEFFWIDSLHWRQPPHPIPIALGGRQSEAGGAIVMDIDLPPEARKAGMPVTAIDRACDDDRQWFEAHPGESVRERPYMPGEGINEPPPGYEGWVRVVQSQPGTRSRETTFRPIRKNA